MALAFECDLCASTHQQENFCGVMKSDHITFDHREMRQKQCTHHFCSNCFSMLKLAFRKLDERIPDRVEGKTNGNKTSS